MKKKIFSLLPNVALIVFILGNISYIRKVLKEYGLSLIDFHGQWAICAHVLRGADPYQAIGVEPPLFDDIGAIPGDWGTSPWGCVLGNIFYPGWLPFESAVQYFFVINFVMLILTVACFVVQLKDSMPRVMLVLFALMILTSPNFWHAPHQGNCGGMICCLLLIACLIYEKHSILAGVALSFAMVKPQTTLLICLAFLLMKQYKPLIVAAAIDLTAWVTTSILIGQTPLTVLLEFLTGNIGGGARRGILSLWAEDLPNPLLVMPLSMLLGIILVVLLQRLIDQRSDNLLIRLGVFVPAFAATNIWCYAWENERFTLTLPIVLGLWLITESKNIFEPVLLIFLAACCDFYIKWVGRLQEILMFATGAPEALAMQQSITLLELSYMVMGIVVAFKLKSTRA